MKRVYLISGGNMNNRTAMLNKAADLIETQCGKIILKSKFYESEGWGMENSPRFLNQVLHLETNLSPEILLTELLGIENKLGRVRNNTGQYESRTIDLDILLYNDEKIENKNLVIRKNNEEMHCSCAFN